MLLPEPMSRILVIGTKDQLKETIDTLYKLENTHVVDFSGDEEGFEIGKPLPAASDASEKLIRLRSVEKDLDIDDVKVDTKLPVSEVEKNLAESVESLSKEIGSISEIKSGLQQNLGDLDNRRKALQPFVNLPLDLEYYKGYTNLDVLAGYIKSDPKGALTESLKDFEIFESADGDFTALFVKKSDSDEAQRILIQNGFTEVPIPDGTGKPSALINEIDSKEAELEKQYDEISTKLHDLREKHAAYILASEEHLSIIVEKAETPLRFGETAHSFIVEAWVPTAEVESVKSALDQISSGKVYAELLENQGRDEYHDTHEEQAVEAGVFTAEGVTKPIKEETPVKMEHKKTGRLFEFYTKLISTPRYNEIDPTITIALFFPIFFGLMVGDVGYGIPFTVLGYLGLKKVKSDEWKAISTMLFFGGIWSIIFGIFLFGDMFGIEFVTSKAGEISWALLLGSPGSPLPIPHVLADFGIFKLQLGYFNKLDDVTILLFISLWIGIAHLLIGLALGFYNIALRHGLKHAIFEKMSWIMMLVGGAFLLLFLVDALLLGKSVELLDIRLIIGLVLLIPGILMAVKAEGGKAIIELPGLMSNVLSYTRLIAIGMSKAGMALAFNFIALEMIAPGGGIMIIIALLVFVVGHLMIFILAIISAGLHAIRLQYVELFQKFYEGGGLEFNPLRIRRKYTKTEE